MSCNENSNVTECSQINILNAQQKILLRQMQASYNHSVLAFPFSKQVHESLRHRALKTIESMQDSSFHHS